jgi:hypothetical protein
MYAHVIASPTIVTSKALCFLPCTKNITGEGVATLYLRRLLPWFRLPRHIISDRDPHFTSHFSKELARLLHVKQNISTAFHPRTDGASERANQKIEQYLRLWIPEQQEQWADYLSMAEFVYNSWPQDATGQSAHELLFGFQPHCTIDNDPTPVPAVEDRLTHLRQA